MTSRPYAQVEVGDGARFTVLLDGKPARTPLRAPLAVPSRRLAEALAAEWRAQGEKVEPRSMPLTMLANTAIDRIARERPAVIAALTGFGAHDLLCYRSEDPALAQVESKGWDPLLAWAAARYGAVLEVTAGIGPVEQHAHLRLGSALSAYDDFALAGLSPAVAITGSLVLGLALAEGRLEAAEAFALSRIDETWQAEKWGADVGAVRRAGALERELAAAAAFIALAKPV